MIILILVVGFDCSASISNFHILHSIACPLSLYRCSIVLYDYMSFNTLSVNSQLTIFHASNK